jgi:hypothetical protein
MRDPENQMALYKVEATVEVQLWAWDEAHARRVAPNTLSLRLHGGGEDWEFVEVTNIEDTGRYQ